MKNLPLAIILGLSLFFSGCPAPFEYWRMQVSGEEGYLRLTKITSREDLVDTESPFALSKDGSKIAFISWKSGNGDIYVRPLGTGSRALIQKKVPEKSV
jgi:Tol biopolymer transport system component